MSSKQDGTPLFRHTDTHLRDTEASLLETAGRKKGNVRGHWPGASGSSLVSASSSVAFTSKQLRVVEAMRWAWNEGYEKYAFGQDLLRPLSKRGDKWNDYGIGLSILDTMDTLYLMKMDAEFERARQWCKEELTFNVDVYVNLFETTIRALGGLLSAYVLSGSWLVALEAVSVSVGL